MFEYVTRLYSAYTSKVIILLRDAHNTAGTPTVPVCFRGDALGVDSALGQKRPNRMTAA
jgi:hypothetical protein